MDERVLSVEEIVGTRMGVVGCALRVCVGTAAAGALPGASDELHGEERGRL